MAVTHWWLVVVAVIPALLATILVFLDQQITAVIVNRSEHKLKVGLTAFRLNIFARFVVLYISEPVVTRAFSILQFLRTY